MGICGQEKGKTYQGNKRTPDITSTDSGNKQTTVGIGQKQGKNNHKNNEGKNKTGKKNPNKKKVNTKNNKYNEHKNNLQ